MKDASRQNGINSVLFFLTVAVLFFGIWTCQRFEPEGFLHVQNCEIINVEERELQVSAEIPEGGGADVDERGFCWSISGEPRLSDNVIKEGQGEGQFSATISGLNPSTSYTIRAFAANSFGTTYSDSIRISTLADKRTPELSTNEVSEITPSTAESGGEVTDEGSASVIARGVCWSTEEHPTIHDPKSNDGDGMGRFESELDSLSCETVYFVRAYAINEFGPAYGNQVSFSTGLCPVHKPIVTTDSIRHITETGAQCYGTVTSDGGGTVSARGMCWSTLKNPEVGDPGTMTSDGEGMGSFKSVLEELIPGTTYFVSAYAINEAGPGYGAVFEFTTAVPNIVKDVEGNVYQTVQIGDQVWMAENLRTKKYPDGTDISYVESDAEWFDIRLDGEAYCWYDNNASYKNVYGALYTPSAALNGSAGSYDNPSGVQGVCPDGWHLPSDAEWKQLEQYLGMTDDIHDEGFRGPGVGDKLRSTGYTYWLYSGVEANNESGFSALPAGRRTPDGIFEVIKQGANFWTATKYDSEFVWYRGLGYHDSRVYRYFYRGWGLSVRCIQD